MTEERKQIIEEAVNTISRTYKRVLIANCYEGYEYRMLKEALRILAEELNNK